MSLWNCAVSRRKVGSCKQEWKRARFERDNIFFCIFAVWSIKLLMLQNQELSLSFKWKLKNSFQGELGRRRDISVNDFTLCFLWYDSLHWNNWRTEIDYSSIIWSGALVSNNTIWESFCVTRFEHLYSGCFILRDCRSQKVKLCSK